MNHRDVAAALRGAGAHLMAAENAETAVARDEALQAFVADLEAAAAAVLAQTPFDQRDRVVTCVVQGCDAETATYFDRGAGEAVLQRYPICPEHEAAWRAGRDQFLLDPYKVHQMLVLPEGATVYAELEAKLQAANVELQARQEAQGRIEKRLENVEAYVAEQAGIEPTG